MQNKNIHQQKLYSLILAGITFLGLILPWAVVDLGIIGGRTNGFSGWGILTLLGVVGVVVSSLLEDKFSPYSKTMKLGAMASFGAITLGAFIVLMQIVGNRGGFNVVKTGIGLWLALIAGILGLLWLNGVIKLNPKSP
ncbi:MAG: hypothetical protein H7Y42_16190 [Chitinophagaceae bacterium]|nr:hypothetical protein [Chitinophagaceae bacterium]